MYPLRNLVFHHLMMWAMEPGCGAFSAFRPNSGADGSSCVTRGGADHLQAKGHGQEVGNGHLRRRDDQCMAERLPLMPRRRA